MAYGIYALGKGFKSRSEPSCASTWKNRKKTVFVFNSCLCLQVDSWWHLHMGISFWDKLPTFPPDSQDSCVRTLHQGRGATAPTE